MNSRVNHERRRIEHTVRSAINNFAMVIDLDQIRFLHEGKCPPKRVHPEGCWIDRVTEGDMTSHACRI